MSPPRDNRGGAVPEVELARIDSDVHHTREQADIDRRTTAARFVELRRELEGIHIAQATQSAQLARVTDLSNRMDVAVASQKGTLESIALELAERRGGIKIVGALAVAVPVALKVLEHVFK